MTDDAGAVVEVEALAQRVGVQLRAVGDVDGVVVEGGGDDVGAQPGGGPEQLGPPGVGAEVEQVEVIPAELASEAPAEGAAGVLAAGDRLAAAADLDGAGVEEALLAGLGVVLEEDVLLLLVDLEREVALGLAPAQGEEEAGRVDGRFEVAGAAPAVGAAVGVDGAGHGIAVAVSVERVRSRHGGLCCTR